MKFEQLKELSIDAALAYQGEKADGPITILFGYDKRIRMAFHEGAKFGWKCAREQKEKEPK